MQTPQRLAFIGLGIMGNPMAAHLLRAGHAVTVHNRTRSKADELLKAGATWSDTPAAAAAHADVVFICVTDTPDVEAVLFANHGVFETIRPHTIVIDHSTISPTATKRFAQRLAEHQATLLDAPVSGGDVGARNATLAIMVGGDRPAFDRALPLLQHLGKTITHCGPAGSGQLTKLVNQILVSVTNLAVCEALTLATTGNLDGKQTIEAVAAGAAGSWQLSNLGPRMITGDRKPGFMIDLQLKDLRLVQEAAADLGLHLPAVELVTSLFKQAQALGHGREGTQGLFDEVRRAAEHS
ncbi:MAG TPA: NAD(P)-dependent oxidoreductase [Tepidisphaeraceae bacterium]|nr:NAD(P)-dependent oxidoreductase [Tepidisphaeraceae bacterium]